MSLLLLRTKRKVLFIVNLAIFFAYNIYLYNGYLFVKDPGYAFAAWFFILIVNTIHVILLFILMYFLEKKK